MDKPTVEEVATYCQERQNQVDPQHWFDYYTSNGWKVGRNTMKDWKAAVRTWERNGYGNGTGKAEQGEDCPRHPESGLTNWGTCWGCHLEKYSEKETA